MFSLHAFVSLCMREDHGFNGGRGSFLFKPWNWLTGALPCGVLAVFVQRGIKTSLSGNTRGTVTYTKQHHSIILSLSRPHIYLPDVFTQTPCTHAHTYHWHIIHINNQQPAHNINWVPKGLIMRDIIFEHGKQLLIIKYLQINNSIFHNMLRVPDGIWFTHH